MKAKIFLKFFLFICVLATPTLAFSADKNPKESEKLSNADEETAKKEKKEKKEKAKKEKEAKRKEDFKNSEARKNSRF